MSGGGIYADSSCTVTNSIFWGNLPDSMNAAFPGAPQYCDIQGGSAQAWFDPQTCLDADPLFVNPAGGDCHLTWVSPCVNRGVNDPTAGPDADGDLRPQVGTADLGADEFSGTHPLSIQVFTLSASQGGDIDFTLNAGAINANRPYIMLGSLSGSLPAFGLPSGMHLALEWDGFTDLVVAYLNNFYFLDFMSRLDATGQGYPRLHVPGLSPVWVGHTMTYAATLYSPFNFVTNPVAIEVVP